MYPEDIIKVESIIFKFLWNKKLDGKCPDRIQRQVLKNNYEMGGLTAPNMGALNSALKVKLFLNATKSKNKITNARRRHRKKRCNVQNKKCILKMQGRGLEKRGAMPKI
jgi:hypothetical protein